MDVRPTAPGKYNVTFIPNKPGEYSTHFVFNGEDIPGSPVKCLVNDPTRIVAHGDGLHQVTHHVISTVTDLRGGGGSREGRHSFVEAHFPEIFSICPEISIFEVRK